MPQRITNDTEVATITGWGASNVFPGCRGTYYAAIQAGRLSAIRSRRRTLIRRADLESWVLEGMPTTPIEPDANPIQ